MKLTTAQIKVIEQEIATRPGQIDPIQRVFNQANDFFHAACRCAAEDQTDTGGLWPGVPMLTNTAFACELYFKALLLQSAKSAHGHELRSLYGSLPEADRNGISDEYMKLSGEGTGQFLQDLADISRAFVDWRYIYEEKLLRPIALADVHALARSLLRFILQTKAWPMNETLVALLDVELPQNITHLIVLPDGRTARLRQG